MQGKRFLRSLRLTNLLSYGPDSETFELLPLNVLIGRNGSGKSNLVDALALLRSAPLDFLEPIRMGGGILEWVWKGNSPAGEATVDATLENAPGKDPLRYRMVIAAENERASLVDEAIEYAKPSKPGASEPFFFYRFQRGDPVVFTTEIPAGVGSPDSVKEYQQRSGLKREDMIPNQSVLAQLKDPTRYPAITYLGRQLQRICIFTEWNLGRRARFRQAQHVDLPSDFLTEDLGNLWLVCNDLESRHPKVWDNIVAKLRTFNPAVSHLKINISVSTVQLLIHEEQMSSPIPAVRLSDGTLRFLCLLVVLCHPNPPPLVCIEEPELGLHPDMLKTVAELLIDASKRMQLIVTTHSDVLVSALSDVPEAVVVCEKDESGTKLKRLEPDKLEHWLKKYSLGEVWSMGEIGGNRW